MDFASMLAMLQGGGGGAAPAAGAMPQQGGPGFGLGQQLVQGGQMAQPQGAAPGGIAGMMGQMDPEKLKGLLSIAQMLQPQGQNQGPMAQMMAQQMGMPQQMQTQAQRGYLTGGSLGNRRG